MPSTCSPSMQVEVSMILHQQRAAEVRQRQKVPSPTLSAEERRSRLIRILDEALELTSEFFDPEAPHLS